MDGLIPSNMSEVESLVQELYQPGTPQRIAKIQETLQTLQRSAAGWQFANSLLESKDEKVQFFGALTFTVKLNSDFESLNPDDAVALLNRILNWLVLLSSRGAGPLVIRKICSTLVIYFLRFSSSWTKCVKHVIYSLSTCEIVPLLALDQAPETSVLLQRLGRDSTMVALWFSTILAEEVGKTDGNNIKHHKFHDRLKNNVDDVVDLIRCGLADSSGGTGEQKVRQDSMKCFQAWVLYSHRAYIDAGITLKPLSTLTNTAIACLVQEEMYEVTVELFSEILANYSRFLTENDFQLLYTLFNSDWSRERYTRLVQGDHAFDSLQFGQFMLAFGDATAQDLAQKTDRYSQQFLTALGGLLAAEGYAVSDDEIFVPALEFWETFVEVLIDSLYSVDDASSDPIDSSNISVVVPDRQDELPWLATARTHVMKAIESCWRKIQFPPPEIFDSWDSVHRTGFTDARSEVIDLMQASYTLIGLPLFSMFATMTLSSLATGAWGELEASLFCLSGLSDCIPDDASSDAILENVFGSALFGIVADPASEATARVRQATLSLIGEYGTFFQMHTQYLPPALTFLFKALSSPSLASTASRSIFSLCSTCRQSLTLELDAFLQNYRDLNFSRTIDGIVKERITGAISSIVQAVSIEGGKIVPLLQLLDCIEQDFQHCLELLANKSNEEAELCALEALRCLGSVAKGLQVPNDLPIDLDHLQSSVGASQTWADGAGAAIQQRILMLIEKTTALFPKSGEIIEAACIILRAGFTERIPGPFVFPPAAVVDFVLKADPSTPRLGLVIGTACSFISSQSSGSSEKVEDALSKLCQWLCAILQYYQEPVNDPEIAQAGIDFLFRLLPVYPNVLMSQPSNALEFIFTFTLRALTGRDPLPKSAAADFWSAFLSLANLPTDLQSLVGNAMEHLGPSLAEALIYNFGGNAARSELDKLSDPLKKLVVKQVHAKKWLEKALTVEGFTSDKVNENDKRIFLRKVISLRGARNTNQVVKDFWLACRGSNFAYAS